MIKTENFIQWYEPGHFESETRAWDVETILGTLTTNGKTKVFETNGGGKMDNLKIRKLTPCECWRLMGRTDTDFEKAEKVCSNSQLYKQAGNSIVVDVLVYLFGELFRQYPTERNKNG